MLTLLEHLITCRVSGCLRDLVGHRLDVFVSNLLCNRFWCPRLDILSSVVLIIMGTVRVHTISYYTCYIGRDVGIIRSLAALIVSLFRVMFPFSGEVTT